MIGLVVAVVSFVVLMAVLPVLCDRFYLFTDEMSDDLDRLSTLDREDTRG